MEINSKKELCLMVGEVNLLINQLELQIQKKIPHDDFMWSNLKNRLRVLEVKLLNLI